MNAELSAAAQMVLGSVSHYLNDKLPVMRGYGEDLFGLLALCVMIWYGVKVILSQGVIYDVMGGLLRKLLVLGAVYWILTPEGYQMVFVDGVVGSLDQIAVAMMPGGYDTPAGALGNAASRLFVAGQQIFDAFAKQSGSGVSLLTKIGLILNSPGLFFELGMSAVFIFVASIMYFIIGLYQQYAVAIAVILGPLFIPWILIPNLSFLAEGWLRQLISASLLKIISAIVFGISDGGFDFMVDKVKEVTHGQSSINDLMVAGWTAACLAMMMVYMLLQVREITNGFVAGNNISVGGMLQAARGAVAGIKSVAGGK